jgi:hypothetical protein
MWDVMWNVDVCADFGRTYCGQALAIALTRVHSSR